MSKLDDEEIDEESYKLLEDEMAVLEEIEKYDKKDLSDSFSSNDDDAKTEVAFKPIKKKVSSRISQEKVVNIKNNLDED